MKINTICFVLLKIIIYITSNILIGKKCCKLSSKFLLKKIIDFYLLSNINEEIKYVHFKTKFFEKFKNFKMKDILKIFKFT